MKKIILSLVFVFAMVSVANANSNYSVNPVNVSTVGDKVELSRDCDNEALRAGESADLAGYSMEEIFVYMNIAYALCEGYTYEEIEAAGNL
ncbi:MAG: hypothetical protein IBX66_10230 [Lutibacter sp.]|nr:hypothetical protein [Lutibacter sp.]